jgi:hypothetical protein
MPVGELISIGYKVANHNHYRTSKHSGIRVFPEIAAHSSHPDAVPKPAEGFTA